MNILCISASNTNRGDNSASTKVCELIKEHINLKEHKVSTISLVDSQLKSCRMCGDCNETQRCLYDFDFNQIFEKICNSQAIFIVVPHYSPIPSKLLMIFEKINEILYASWIQNPDYISPTSKIRVGLIGHGGMAESEKVLKYYHDQLITPIANTLRSLSFEVIGENEWYPNGSVFGLEDDQSLIKNEKTIFPDITHDYGRIKDKIKPIINNVVLF